MPHTPNGSNRRIRRNRRMFGLKGSRPKKRIENFAQ
jgi:hypothetical protein